MQRPSDRRAPKVPLREDRPQGLIHQGVLDARRASAQTGYLLGMTNAQSAPETARTQLLSLLDELCTLAAAEGQSDQASFFARIRSGVQNAQDAEDLADPFMELSTSAFRGFLFSPSVELRLDEVLAIAQTLAATLSASGEKLH